MRSADWSSRPPRLLGRGPSGAEAARAGGGAEARECARLCARVDAVPDEDGRMVRVASAGSPPCFLAVSDNDAAEDTSFLLPCFRIRSFTSKLSSFVIQDLQSWESSTVRDKRKDKFVKEMDCSAVLLK